MRLPSTILPWQYAHRGMEFTWVVSLDLLMELNVHRGEEQMTLGQEYTYDPATANVYSSTGMNAQLAPIYLPLVLFGRDSNSPTIIGQDTPASSPKLRETPLAS